MSQIGQQPLPWIPVDEVAVKIESISGALAVEARALEWLDAHGGPAPRLRYVGRVVSGDEVDAACIVCDHAPVRPATAPAEWSRLGRARLGRMP